MVVVPVTPLRTTAGWIDSEGYDIEARAEAGTTVTPRQTLNMLQGLLEERFNLKFHRETRELPIYALQVAKNGTKTNLPGPIPAQACRCQAMTVAGLTMTRAERQPDHSRESQTHSHRSAAWSMSRFFFWVRCSTIS